MNDKKDFKDDATNPDAGDQALVQNESGTRVDLGEDLLEQTKVGLLIKGAIQQSDSDKRIEELANAEILISERIYDEAKKIYRKIIRLEPSNLKVKALLQAVLELEIQDLLNTDSRAGNRIAPASITREKSTEELISDLEKDLRINLSRGENKIVPDLFPNPAAESEYIRNLLQSIEKLSPKDQMDIGIAQLEMGLHSAAKAVFEELIKYDEYKIPGMYLLGHALINGNEHVEATIRLEPLVRDITLADDKKCDFLYLMGISFEQLGEVIKSKEFFRKVYALNPRYRNVVEKLR